MDSEEAIENQKSDNDDTIHHNTDQFIAISSHKDAIKLHIDILTLKDCEVNTLIKCYQESLEFLNISSIIDISNATLNYSIKEIDCLSLKVLNPNISLENDKNLLNNDADDVKSLNENSNEEFEDESCGLNDRHKSQKLSLDQIKYLKNQMSNCNYSIKEIQEKYYVSYSALNKIKKSSWSQINEFKQRKLVKLSDKQNKLLIKVVSDYIMITKYTITTKDVTDFVNNHFNSEYSISFIRKFMKSLVKCNFKIVKSRPNTIDLKKIDSLRNLFSIKLSKLMSSKTLLINIDESSINWNTKYNYSWGFKGTAIEAQNSTIADSASIIMGICSNGSWISFITSNTVNSITFTWFLKVLLNCLKSNNCFEYTQIIFLLDNCAIHKSIITRDCLTKTGCLTFFIPPYSPDFAPVEMCFSVIKRKLKEIFRKETGRVSIKYNYAKIYDSLQTLKAVTIRKMFYEFFNTIRRYL